MLALPFQSGGPPSPPPQGHIASGISFACAAAARALAVLHDDAQGGLETPGRGVRKPRRALPRLSGFSCPLLCIRKSTAGTHGA